METEQPKIPYPTPHPWYRFFARLIDLVVFGRIADFIAVAMPFTDNIAGYNVVNRDKFLVVGSLQACVLILCETISIGATGTTPGKACFKIQVRQSGAEKLPGFARALLRTILLYLYTGLAFNGAVTYLWDGTIVSAALILFPIVCANVVHYVVLMQSRVTFYDWQAGLSVGNPQDSENDNPVK